MTDLVQRLEDATEGTRRPRGYFGGKPMTFHESLHWCGCASCRNEIAERLESEPPMKPDFVAYLIEQYPNTARILKAKATASPDTGEGG